MSEDQNEKLARLLREAERLKGRAGVTPGSPAAGGSITGDMSAVREGLGFIGRTVRWCKNATMGLLRAFSFLKPVVDAYKAVFSWFCYKTNKQTGERTFKRGRGLLFTVSTAVLATAAIPGAIGEPSRYVRDTVLDPVSDLASMSRTYSHNEVMYLTNSQELLDSTNTHSVKGCRTQDCSDGGVYFLVRNSLAHNVWSGVARGNPFYVTDMETASITPGMNRCEVTSYGFRARFFQAMQIYPTILSAQCTPLYNSAARPAAPAAAPAPAPAMAAPLAAPAA